MGDSWLLIGTGPMARAYADVLAAQRRNFRVASRSAQGSAAFGSAVGAGGWTTLPDLCAADVQGPVIVCTSPESLGVVTKTVLQRGARQILTEKPGALSSAELFSIANLARASGADLRIATNRRFYGSVLDLARRLREDPPVAATFDFTEWPDRVAASGRSATTLSRWALANSVHVIDTVTHLLGPVQPEVVQVSDQDQISWHPAGATFAGFGRCSGTPVTWASSWIAPGRWSIEIRSRNASYRLAPMEELRVRRPETVTWEVVAGDDLDERHKPGVHRMVEAFAKGDPRLPTADAFAGTLAATEQLAGYLPAAVPELST